MCKLLLTRRFLKFFLLVAKPTRIPHGTEIFERIIPMKFGEIEPSGLRDKRKVLTDDSQRISIAQIEPMVQVN